MDQRLPLPPPADEVNVAPEINVVRPKTYSTQEWKAARYPPIRQVEDLARTLHGLRKSGGDTCVLALKPSSINSTDDLAILIGNTNENTARSRAETLRKGINAVKESFNFKCPYGAGVVPHPHPRPGISQFAVIMNQPLLKELVTTHRKNPQGFAEAFDTAVDPSPAEELARVIPARTGKRGR